MIFGEHSVKTKVLEKAVNSSILAGSTRGTKKNTVIAIDNEVKLLRHHRELGHQTPFETARSLETERLLLSEHRRWNLTRGYYSVALDLDFL
jgi:hypothetical protein|tara:strand:+ start:238 stop:513 length:276 start_codon:yes stop_codon:yes gene_type:complete